MVARDRTAVLFAVCVLALSGLFGAALVSFVPTSAPSHPTNTLPPDTTNNTITNPTYTTEYGHLLYSGVYDGYLWTVQSNPILNVSKWDEDTHTLLQTTTPDDRFFEIIGLYVYQGIIYLGGAANQNSILYGAVEELNESTLMEILFFEAMYSTYISPRGDAYDPVSHLILFDADMRNWSIGVWGTVPGSGYYQFINVGLNPGGSSNQVVIFQGQEDVVSELPTMIPTEKVTRMYVGTNLSDWKLVWQENCSILNYGYFPHISCDPQWIAVGILAGQSYEIEFSNGSGWQVFNTTLPYSYGEQHPDISAISGGLFLFEHSQRFVISPHHIYLFNCSDESLEPLGNIPCEPGGMPSGYDDCLSMVGSGGVMYISNCEYDFAQSQLDAQIWMLNLSSLTLTLWMTSSGGLVPSGS